MSTAGSQGPNALGPQYGGVGGGGGFAPSAPTPTSTVHDDYPHHDVKVSLGPGSGLPPFSSFEMADGHTYTQLDQPWEYYGEGLTGRLMERGDMHNQPNYRPWESKPMDGSEPHPHPPGPPPPGHPFPGSKLPSFQSQFSFAEQQQQQHADGVLTPLTPASSSPSSTSSGQIGRAHV